MTPTDGKQVTDGPNIKAETWFSLAIATFVITIVVGAFAAAWVFFEDEPTLMVQHAQAFTPFGAAMLAIVTFCTVAWRGVLNTAQLNQQIRQNDANDAVNFAKLLQEGAKLISEREKLSQVIAGISTLEMAVREPQGRYAVEAMDLLAELAVETYDDEKFSKIRNSAIRALAAGSDLGYRSRVRADLSHIKEANSLPRYWKSIKGLQSISFTGGILTKHAFEEMYPDFGTLDGVTIRSAVVNEITDDFYNCRFEDCVIRKISVFDLKSHEFIRCNFSDAEITDFLAKYRVKIDMKSTRNYFRDGQEPCDTDGQPVGFLFLTWEELQDLEESDRDN